jgi:hypothetical protein
MPPNYEEFRNQLLMDVLLLQDRHDHIWTITQELPLGDLRTSLELVHQSSAQVTLNLQKTLEMA